MYNNYNIENDSNLTLTAIHHRNDMIQKMKWQFASFGYKEIHTPAFQPYELYMQMNGTVNQQEMIKTIDNAGNVLVLRPDVTIPLTQRIARHHSQLEQALRYFYTLDVFRQTAGTAGSQENTQIGAEFFGDASAATDAEIIALSMNVLNSIDLTNVTIELGHAGFFKELIDEIHLDKQALNALKQSIRAKNVPEIETLLQQLDVDEPFKEIITSLPFLYGKPEEVIDRARALPLTDAMHQTLDNLMEIYDYLDAYGIKDHIVADLSLINHMDYYSDIIFQGFIEKVGKPVLMGGRYNTLANQFNANIPAVGFACNLDLLLNQANKVQNKEVSIVDICVLHYSNTVKKAIKLATSLRNMDYETMILPTEIDYQTTAPATMAIYTNQDGFTLDDNGEITEFSTMNELIAFLRKER